MQPIETSLYGYTYNQDNGKLKPMRVVHFIIFVVFLGWCCLLAGCDVENDDTTIIAPNVFTPDGEGENNFFIVRSTDDQVVSLKIFTRAGVLIFSIEAKLCVWDGCSLSGQPMADGVYYYTAEVPGSSPKISKNGFVYLYRGKK